MRGKYFEEMTVGDIAESPGRTITESDILSFADFTGDHNPVHTNAEYAKTTIYGEQVAHGLLGLSIAGGLAWGTGLLEGTAEALIGVDWKFRNPIYIGDTIKFRAEVRRKKEMPRMNGGFVTFDATLLNQRDETVQKGTWTLLIRSRPEEGEKSTRLHQP
ncbi:MAG TPA: dehydratase [Anaerolineae bacterium]|nr:dehydratase [Anaerolineae bacterium]